MFAASAQQMFANLESSEIRPDGLFLNFDSEFNKEDFRRYCSDKEIMGKIDHNMRNGATKEYLFNDLLYNFKLAVERTNAGLKLLRLKRYVWYKINLLGYSVILLRKLYISSNKKKQKLISGRQKFKTCEKAT